MNQDNNSFMLCPKCGAQNKQNAILCMKCGFNFHLYQEEMNIKQDKEFDVKKDQRNNIKSIIMLIISLINISLVFPFLVKYSFLWQIFGNLKTPKYYYWYLFTSGYALASIIAVIFSIISFIFRGKTNKSIFVAIAICFTIGVILAIAINKFDLV